MATQGRIENPNFEGILEGRPRAIHDAIQLLMRVGNLALERIDKRRLVWQSQAYDSALFGASAGTWTVASGDFTAYRFLFADFLLRLHFVFENTSTDGSIGAELHLGIPLNLSARSAHFTGVTHITGSGIQELGLVTTRSGANATTLALQRADGSGWPASESDTLTIRGAIDLEIG